MNINSMFPSDWLKAADLQGRPVVLTMGNVTSEKFDDGQRPVLHFQDAERGLVLNKTNANTISAIYGEETDGWFGRRLEVYPSETDYQGKRVACIRVRAPQANSGQQPPAPPPASPDDYHRPLGDDEFPPTGL